MIVLINEVAIPQETGDKIFVKFLNSVWKLHTAFIKHVARMIQPEDKGLLKRKGL